MTGPREWIPSRLVRAALDVPGGSEAIGEAIWLYLYLLIETDQQGRLCRTSDRVAADLSADESEIESWLKRLADAGLVTVLSPAPFLAIKLPMWPGRGSNHGGCSRALEDSYSSRAIAAMSNQGETGGLGGGEGLLEEILETLGERDPEPFRKVLEHFPPAMVRKALARVRAARPDRIRRSKTALFRYLLGQYSKSPTP